MINLNRSNPPVDKITPFNIKDFSGGLNNKTELRDNQERLCLNMSFASNLQVDKRLGIYPSLSEVTTSTNDITFINEFKPYTGANQPVYFASDKVVIGSFEFDITNAMYGVT